MTEEGMNGHDTEEPILTIIDWDVGIKKQAFRIRGALKI